MAKYNWQAKNYFLLKNVHLFVTDLFARPHFLAVDTFRVKVFCDVGDHRAQQRVLGIQNWPPITVAWPHQLLESVAEVRVPVEGILVGEGGLGHEKLVGLVNARGQARLKGEIKKYMSKNWQTLLRNRVDSSYAYKCNIVLWQMAYELSFPRNTS